MAEILLFTSSNCPHCPKAASVARKIIPEFKDQNLYYEKIRLKTQQGKELSARYAINAFPTMLLFDDDKNIKYKITGVPSKDSLRNKINKLLGLKKSFLDKIFKK